MELGKMVREAGLGEQYIDLGMLSFQESCSDIRAEVVRRQLDVRVWSSDAHIRCAVCGL